MTDVSHTINLHNRLVVEVPLGCGRNHIRKLVEMALRGIKPARKRMRKPTLTSVAKQASKAGIGVRSYEIRPDNTIVVVTGEPEPAAPDNPWPLDEFRTKEIKQ
jgi:hypothetical protein